MPGMQMQMRPFKMDPTLSMKLPCSRRKIWIHDMHQCINISASHAGRAPTVLCTVGDPGASVLMGHKIWGDIRWVSGRVQGNVCFNMLWCFTIISCERLTLQAFLELFVFTVFPVAVARLCKDEPLLRCIIAWDLREVSGCFKRRRVERSFPTKAPLAQSDPQLQGGLKASGMQTWLVPKDLYQRWCPRCFFWESCPKNRAKKTWQLGVLCTFGSKNTISHFWFTFAFGQFQSTQALREKLPASVSLIDDFCAMQPAQAGNLFLLVVRGEISPF